MFSLKVDIKEVSLTVIIFMMSLTFLIGPALEIIPTSITLLLRAIYLVTLLLMILRLNEVRNSHIFLFFLISFYLLFKFESMIFVNYLSIILLCIYLRFYQVDNVISKVFITVCILVFFHVLLYELGIVADSIDANYSGRSRISMGFSNPNQLAIFYFSVFIVSYAKLMPMKNLAKIKIILPLMLIVYSIYVIIISDSRTSLFGCMIVVLSHFMIRGELLKLIIIRLCVLMLVLLTFLIAFFHGTFLDPLLSYRPIIFYEQLMRMEGFSLFWGLYEMKQIDNLVVNILTSIGYPIFFVLWLWSVYCIRKIDMRFFPLIVAILLMSIFEAFLLRPELPISLLFLSFIVCSDLDNAP